MGDGEQIWQIPLSEREKILTKHASFAELSVEERQMLAGLLHEQEVAEKETVVQESNPIDSVYFIIKGSADVVHIKIVDGQQQVEKISVLRPGDAIGLGDAGFFSVTGRRTATVIAKEKMLLLRLGLAVFHGFALTHPRVNQVMREQARRILNSG